MSESPFDPQEPSLADNSSAADPQPAGQRPLKQQPDGRPATSPPHLATPSPSTPASVSSSTPSKASSPASRTGSSGPVASSSSVGDSSMAPIKQLFDRLTTEIGKVYIGQEELVLGTLVAMFSGGHVLIESVPGLGKTLFVRVLGQVLGCRFGRIQFTSDLMPSDITGAPIFNMKTSDFEFRPGPVFTQILLCDEINRSPAKTHAALLEIMQEYHVTVERTSHRLQRPFLVLATQNPIESEGTYNLPEAQLDRFMFKLVAHYPTIEEEARVLKEHSSQVDLDQVLKDQLTTLTSPEKILRATQMCSRVLVDDRLLHYINQVVRLTRKWPQFHMGASPRAGLAFVKAARTLAAFRGRDFAVPDDVAEIALPILRHRVTLTAEAEVEGQQVDELLTALIGTVEVPRM